MSWLKRAARYQGKASPFMRQYYMPARPGMPENVYQCPEAPWVFLGSADPADIQRAELMAGRPICLRVDLTDKNIPLPGPSIKIPLPELRVWDEQSYESVQQEFNRAASRLALIIQSRQCPIYVHCTMGMNRSVSVLSSALTQITGRPLFDIMKAMKAQRGIIGPHDAYLMMALDFSRNEQDMQRREEVRQQIDLDQRAPEMVA